MVTPVPYTANVVRDKLQRFGWETLQHPPYSPDLSPCDFHIFGDLKKDIRGRRLHWDEVVQDWVRLWVHERPTLSTRLELIISSPSGINVVTLLAITALAEMVACLPLVQQVQDSIPGGVVNFNLKNFNLGARRGGDVHFQIARLYITVLH